MARGRAITTLNSCITALTDSQIFGYMAPTPILEVIPKQLFPAINRLVAGIVS
jgi:hypothetical protein